MTLLLLPVFQRRHMDMLPEVAGKKRLVGEIQLEGDFLHASVCCPQQDFHFLDATLVDDVFGRRPRHVLHDRRQVARRDAQFIGIEIHIAMKAAMLDNQRDKLLEQLFLPVGIVDIPAQEILFGPVIHIHQEVLNQVLENLQPERMFTILVNAADGKHLTIEEKQMPFVQRW